ncbi:MAG TPA: histidinol dehydrogenase [Flavitalea sp.]|nr:histidinol dehydrogenase [Flavitalea sp.]
MNIYRYPSKDSWQQLLKRPALDFSNVEEKVNAVLLQVKKDGDKALRKFTAEFDKAVVDNLEVTEQEKIFALNQVNTELFEAIKLAAENITAFHRKQLQATDKMEIMPGVSCWRKNVGIEKVGLYVPGGTAPLFSTVLMLTIPAVLAGCKEIIICTPPSAEGKVHPAILAAAGYVGINKIFKVGGVQAIAAMTFGTNTIPKVNKIFGPGNQYVTAAKQIVQKYGVAIDMPAGPSEVAVFADKTADPSFVAADLLSQAEHGGDSHVLLVTDYEPLIALVNDELQSQLSVLPRKEIAETALGNSKYILVDNKSQAMDLLNEYAPEHLILSCDAPEELAEMVINAGSVFLGHYSPESVGDYASGTNHTLPTGGYAKTYSGVSVDSFVKKITFQYLSEEGLKSIAPAVVVMAETEGLKAHAEAVRVRLKK